MNGEVSQFQDLDSHDLLKTIPPGRYRLPDKTYLKDVYDALEDRMISGPARLYARVREAGAELPTGLDVEIRPDGKQIIKQWIFDPQHLTFTARSHDGR